MDTASYWAKRELQLKKRQIKNTSNYEYALESRLKDLQREINKEVKYWMTKYADNNEISQQEAERILNGIDTKHFELTLEEFERKAKQGGNGKLLNSEYYKSRVARAEQIKKQLEHLGGQFAGTESDQLRRALEAQYADTYYHETWLNQQAYGDLSIDFNHFDEDQLRAVAGKPWQGSDFSERVWGEYRRELPSQLSDAILRGILLGESYAKVSKRMEDRMADVKKSSVHRLVSTEMGHIAEQATYDFYKDEGLEEYEYLATLEARTCSICGGLDGKHFKVSEAKPGVNYPLIHPYCRCTTIPYRPDLPPLETRWERDPKTGKGRIVNYQTYDQWAGKTGAPKAFNPTKVSTFAKKSSTGISTGFTSSGFVSYDDKQRQIAENDTEIRALKRHPFEEILEQSFPNASDQARENIKKQVQTIADMTKRPSVQVRARVPIEKLRDIIEDGLKNQFETGTSKGMFNREGRIKLAKHIYSLTDEEIKSMKPEDYEKYGYLWDSEDEEPKYTAVKKYGSATVVFKDAVKERTTYFSTDSMGTGENSWDNSWRAAKVGELNPSYIRKIGHMKGENGKSLQERNLEKDPSLAIDTHKYSNINKVTNTQTDYTEAQIHGNLSKDDIAYVRIKESEATNNLTEFLSEQGVKYEVIKDEEPGNSPV
ncbi:minor capsid protein [Lactobacillus delbrueckii]|uniref:minor capsid protein n=1 Tax=Lactobacillus delbrueckii TaxID=1584 RepID=UPI0039923E74